MNDFIDISGDDFDLGLPATPLDDHSSTNGAEWLVNNKYNKPGASSGAKPPPLDLNIENLESDLNLMSDNNPKPGKGGSGSGVTFSEPSNSMFGNESIHLDDGTNDSSNINNNINLGQSTSNIYSNDKKSWDEFGQFNDTFYANAATEQPPKMSKDEIVREKFKYWKKLEKLEKKGVVLSKTYSMESNLAEMQGEYEIIMAEKAKDNAIKFQAGIMNTFVNGIEYMNKRFDPFDVNLDGWGDQVEENINDYDEIFGELHEMYGQSATLHPALKLLMQLGGSAVMVHMTNTMLKSSNSIPSNMEDVLRQNPELMRQFQTAALNQMGQTMPGLASVGRDAINRQGPPSHQQQQSQRQYPVQQPHPSETPIFAAPPSPLSARTSGPRAEMRGPSDISNILSGLKTTTIQMEPVADQDDDAVSIASSVPADDAQRPKQSRRKPKSSKNTVSIDL